MNLASQTGHVGMGLGPGVDYTGCRSPRAIATGPPSVLDRACSRGAWLLTQKTHRRFAVKPLSEQLADLSARAKKAEDDAAAARTEARTAIQDRANKLEADAAARRARVDAAATQAKGTVEGQWNDLRMTTNKRMATMRADIDAKKAEHDAKRAEGKANLAEDSAAAAIAFAYDAIDNAEAAVLDAVIARADANAMASA